MLNVIRAPRREDIAPRVNEFLRALPGPVAIHLPGRDSSRTRVLVTLSHGNEPSGLEALHLWLLGDEQPAVNVVVILGSVEAARAEPLFFLRQLPDQRDLNRCFNPPYNKDEQGQLAQSILRYIRDLKPEAVVDMHNTSGSSVAFAVTVGDTPAQRALVGHFVNRLIVTDLRLGSLMEQDLGCPVVTIEAGGSLDENSDIVAQQGMRNFFLASELFSESREIALFRHPLRLELRQHSRIDYADRALHDRDITVRQDIEKFNFAPIDVDEMLGWLGVDGLSHLVIGSACQQPHAVSEFFRVEAGCLYPVQRMHLFMATTRPDIAASDCLFYFVNDVTIDTI
ncbi:Succinylglutamate desuccinylase / Aspartoacylase family protein [Nitrosomonas cryotolerans]|uniref:Succinylglutamate desuccinylase / Aspartoacylase family protein n=1 Tax=Nitrosomonas cryotolerans ATCC 49181 TaxID=1131553 RepID=A0A1N6GNS6_9PROT|nr:succinylglutamate desuccinylase/aspartoacylase family protein [Nitrosomonas cryotolerans]SFP39234.1 Succinylglutamate desuccinylase / Aspartoacylase family protein [Nitrosomonas cryotolerans]SIO09164.1 Succinylglutamate desuccinylase / Aspartoacylase family protein [Nitrosomonas cryotolerans ATCC 49181]